MICSTCGHTQKEKDTTTTPCGLCQKKSYEDKAWVFTGTVKDMTAEKGRVIFTGTLKVVLALVKSLEDHSNGK
tara:strand:+ start:188 stop:406 length:219 start_codon:yes stop_codon:yes gene_type:complete